MSANYERIKKYYDKGYYTDAQMRAMVGKPKGITSAEYEKITGQSFMEV